MAGGPQGPVAAAQHRDCSADTQTHTHTRAPLLQYDGKLGATLAATEHLGAAAASQARFARAALGLPAGACAVVTNGRVVELPAERRQAGCQGGAADVAESHSLKPHDFELLELYAQRNQFSLQAAELVAAAAGADALGGTDASALAAAVSSALAAGMPEEVRGAG